MAIEEIRPMADEVAELMVARFGGPRRGQGKDLASMLRRRGGALPRKLRREAALLAQADVLVNQPRLGRQVDVARMGRAHRALVGHLRPLGKGARWQGRAVSLGASLALALLVFGALALWIWLRRGGI